MDITISLLAQQLLVGLALGSIYVLVGVGLSLIFGLLNVVNFAHGAFYMVGAYAGVALYRLTDNFWLCLAGVPLLVGGFGLLAERWLVRPLYGRGIDYPLLLTFGLAYVLVDLTRMVYGVQGEPFSTPEALRGAVDLDFAHFPLYRLFLVGLCAVIVAVLWAFIERTRLGLIIRAGARDPMVLKVLGIDVGRVWLLIFGIGTGLAALAGLLAAPLRGVNPEMGGPVLVEAFVVTVVGGMGSLVGAVVAGLLVGVVVAMTTLFRPEFAEIAIFMLMAVVLLVRPNGLFGAKA